MSDIEVIVVRGETPPNFGASFWINFNFSPAVPPSLDNEYDEIPPLEDLDIEIEIEGLLVKFNFPAGTTEEIIDGFISAIVAIKNNPNISMEYNNVSYRMSDLWNSLQQLTGVWNVRASISPDGARAASTNIFGGLISTFMHTNVRHTGGDVSPSNDSEYYAFVAFHEALHIMIGGAAGGEEHEAIIQYIDGPLWNQIRENYE